MVAVSLFVFGQFTLFTYLRPFLDLVTGNDAPLISGMLLALGVAGFIGTIIIGWLLKSHLYSLLITIPAMMAIIAITLLEIDGAPLNVGRLLALWGLLSTTPMSFTNLPILTYIAEIAPLEQRRRRNCHTGLERLGCQPPYAVTCVRLT